MIEIGSDPEFAVLKNMDFTEAWAIFSNKDGRIGCDGYSSTGELRPYPGTVDEHLSSIRNLLEMAHRVYPEIDMIAGTFQFNMALGGHIHFSGITYTKTIGELLDYFLAIPFRCIENVSEVERRRRLGYGELSCVRRQPWGWEYRTLPSWLVSPEIANIALSLAMIIVKNSDFLADVPRLKGFDLSVVPECGINTIRRTALTALTTLEQCIPYSTRFTAFFKEKIKNKKKWTPKKESMLNAWGITRKRVFVEIDRTSQHNFKDFFETYARKRHLKNNYVIYEHWIPGVDFIISNTRVKVKNVKGTVRKMRQKRFCFSVPIGLSIKACKNPEESIDIITQIIEQIERKTVRKNV